MRLFLTLRRVVFTAFLAALIPAPLPAQIVELGAFATLGRTGVRELGNPAGFGLSVTWPLGAIASFRLEGSRMTSSPRWTATTCAEHLPFPDGCQEETVENNVRGMQLAALLAVAPLRRSGWRVEGVLGVSRLQLSHEITGTESGRLVPQSSDEEAAFSVSFGAGIIREGVGADRLSARLDWRHARMDGNITSCVPEACPSQWDDLWIDEVRLGAAWRF